MNFLKIKISVFENLTVVKGLRKRYSSLILNHIHKKPGLSNIIMASLSCITMSDGQMSDGRNATFFEYCQRTEIKYEMRLIFSLYS